MTTLKEHQQAMVNLLASGSGIPASAARLAHAMHDLINVLYVAFPNLPQTKDEDWLNAGRETNLTIRPSLTIDIKDLVRSSDANSPGLNDRALAEDIKACRPKLTPAERRVKELENTIRQLKDNNARLRQELHDCRVTGELAGLAETITDSPAAVKLPEQSGVRKEDTQVCEHDWARRLCSYIYQADFFVCSKCGAVK